MAITNKDVELPIEFSREIIRGVQGRSKALELGRRLPNMVGKTYKLNVLTSLAKAGWVKNTQSPANTEGAEINRKPISQIAWEGVDITAETIACIVAISEETLADTEDYGVNVVPTIYEDVVGAFQQVLDATAFFGTDSPWSGFNGIVAGATSAGAVVRWNGNSGTAFYKAVSSAMEMVEKSGYIPTAILGAPSMRSAFRNTITDLGVVAGEQGEVGGLARHYDMTGGFDASTAFAIVGDFKYLVYSFREEMSMKLLTEATIDDPATGNKLYNLAQQDMIAFRFKMRLGMALPNPVNRVSGVASGDVIKKGASSYPFALILKTGEGSK